MFEARKAKRAAHQYQANLRKWQAVRDVLSERLQLARSDRGQLTPELTCRPGESVFAKVTATALIEDRAGPRHYQGRSSGISFPILPGVRYRSGRSGGRSFQSPPTPTVVDMGTLYVTNRRVIFRGAKQTRECLFDKLVGFERSDRTGTMTISVANRRTPTTLRYGRSIAPWFDFRMDLALAHYRGSVAELVGQIQGALYQLDSTKPLPPAPAPPPPPPKALAANARGPARSRERKSPIVIAPQLAQDEIGWGVLAFSSQLSARLGEFDPAYAEFDRPPKRNMPIADPHAYVLQQLDLVMNEIKKIDPLFESSATLTAFGLHGTHGNAKAIAEMVGSVVSIYSTLLDIGLTLRGVKVPPPWQPVALAASNIVREPIDQIRGFSEALARDAPVFLEAVRVGQSSQRTFAVKLKLDVSLEARTAFHTALEGVKRAL